jgi:spoIIIJ-associated protein
MPIPDLKTAAQSVAEFLKLLTASGLRLRYRITAGAGAADPDGLEAREIYVELFGPDSPLLTDRNGELLRAMEHVAARIVHLEPDEHDRISFDADNFKAIRARELKLSAESAAEKVRSSGQPLQFPPMSSRERRMLHLAMRSFTDMQTSSVGEGPARSLVVFPAGYNQSSFVPAPVAVRPAYERGGSSGGRRPDHRSDRRPDRRPDRDRRR